MAEQYIQLTAQCLCKGSLFQSTIARSSLPIETGCCHCTSCRRVTGGMFSCIVPWSGSHQDIWNSSLNKFAFSKHVTLFFCHTCSCPMFFHFPAGVEGGNEDRFEVCAALLPNLPGVDLIRIRDHLFVGDTVDGGASFMLQRPNADGVVVPRWKGWRGESEQLDVDWPSQPDRSKMMKGTLPDEIPIGCKCGGVSFTIQRAKEDYAAMERKNLPYFVDPTTHKLLASCDVCDSCRLTSGTTPVYWISALLKHVKFGRQSGNGVENDLPESASALEAAVTETRDRRFGSLAVYASSNDGRRYSCSECSASIFYTKPSQPDVIDIAIGVLQSPDGARAEGFLTWNYGAIGYMEDVSNGWREGVVGAMKRDAEDWRIKMEIPKCFRRIVKEKETCAIAANTRSSGIKIS